MTPAMMFYAAWSVASVLVFGLVYIRARDRHRRFHDDRSGHELYIATALFMVAISTLFSVGLGLLEAGTFFRLGFSALALGAFLGCGIVILLELPRPRGRKR